MHKLLIVFFLLTGCTLLPGGSSLDGDWRLVSGDHDGSALPLTDDVPVTLSLAGSQVSGQSGCNSISGSAAITADGFRLGELASTGWDASRC